MCFNLRNNVFNKLKGSLHIKKNYSSQKYYIFSLFLLYMVFVIFNWMKFEALSKFHKFKKMYLLLSYTFKEMGKKWYKNVISSVSFWSEVKIGRFVKKIKGALLLKSKVCETTQIINKLRSLKLSLYVKKLIPHEMWALCSGQCNAVVFSWKRAALIIS